MPTIDGGFVVGDLVTPEDFNNTAPKGLICQVVEEDNRYSMKVRFPAGYDEWVHPYRWKKAPRPRRISGY